MTDRHAGYIITLKSDIREDDAKATLTALRQIKGVVAVQPVVADVQQHLAISRVRCELADQVYGAINDVLYPR